MARKEPQNLDAEINALGCAFLNKEALDPASAGCSLQADTPIRRT